MSKIYLDKRQNKDGTFQLRVAVSFFGRRYITSLGVAISLQEFENLQQIISGEKLPSYKRSVKLSTIEKMLSDIDNAIEWQKTKVRMHEITAESVDIANLINTVKGKKKHQKIDEKTVEVLFIEFMRSERTAKDFSEMTIKGLNNAKRHLFIFDKNITLQQLNSVETLTKLTEYFVTNKYASSSVRHYLSFIKWFLRWCYNNSYCGNEFEKFKCQLKMASIQEKLVVFLSLDEIQKIADMELHSDFDNIVRDRFLFQCYTGLRHSDVSKLKKSDIDGVFMRLSIQKTGTYIENRLNDLALAIYYKYKDVGTSELLFPNVNFGTFERHLKTMAKLAGINEPVTKVEYRNHQRIEYTVPKWQLMTTHVARKSFVVNSLDLGLTATQVIAYTGHSTIQAMQPYISISQKKKDAAMDVWNDIPKNKNKKGD
jgi:integrase